MGYMLVFAPCFGCKHLFYSNPHRVPAYQGQPICRDCITLFNAKRRATGLSELTVHADAYDAVNEAEG